MKTKFNPLFAEGVVHDTPDEPVGSPLTRDDADECYNAENMGYSDGPVPMALQWLKSALECKTFAWDGDQHDYAEQSMGDATLWLDRMTKELAELRKEKLRLDWMLSFATGAITEVADKRTMLLAQEIYAGLDGRAAVDAAMAKAVA